MARTKTRKKTTPKRRATRAKKPPRIQRIGPYLPAVLASMLVLAILGGAAMLRGELTDLARARRVATPPAIIVHWPADTGSTLDSSETWVPEAQQRELLELIRESLALAGDPLAIDGLRNAGLALERTGWFEDSPTLRRMPDGSVEVQGEWRVPRAWIRSEGVDYLVDAQGRLMPLAHSAEREFPKRTPVINPGTRPPRTPAGLADYDRPWASATVWSAIELMDLLRAQSYFEQIGAIDAGGVGPNPFLTIVTDRNTRIIWGSGPNGFHPGERPTKEKLFHLARFHAEDEFGRHIDAGMGGYDLRSGYIVLDREMTRAPETPDE